MDQSLFKKHRETLVIIGVALVSLFLAKKAYDFQLGKAWWIKESIRKEEKKAMTLDRIVVLNERLEDLKEGGWPSTDFASVVEVLTQLGRDADMRVQEITPMPREEETHLVSIPFFLNAYTTYRGVVRFLVAIRQLPEVLRVHEVTLRPAVSEAQAGYEVTLKMNLKGEALYFK